MLVQLNIISVSQILECYNFSVSFQGRFSGGVPEDAECPKSGVLYPKIMKTTFKNIHQRSILSYLLCLENWDSSKSTLQIIARQIQDLQDRVLL